MLNTKNNIKLDLPPSCKKSTLLKSLCHTYLSIFYKAMYDVMEHILSTVSTALDSLTDTKRGTHKWFGLGLVTRIISGQEGTIVPNPK